jgi:hypothetical protein
LEACGGGYAGDVADHVDHGFGLEAGLTVGVCGRDNIEEEVDLAGERRGACGNGCVAGGGKVAARGVETAAGCTFEGGRSSGRLGELVFTAGIRFARCGELCTGGDTKRCSTWGGMTGCCSSTEFMIEGIEGITGLICARGDIIGRTTVGSKVGPAKRCEKRCNCGSSG